MTSRLGMGKLLTFFSVRGLENQVEDRCLRNTLKLLYQRTAMVCVPADGSWRGDVECKCISVREELVPQCILQYCIVVLLHKTATPWNRFLGALKRLQIRAVCSSTILVRFNITPLVEVC